MLKASPFALELSKLLFDNMHKISVIEWEIYISVEERDKGFEFDDEFKLDIFKAVFDERDGHQSDGLDYRIGRKKENLSKNNLIVKPKEEKMKNKSSVQISALPLASADKMEFIKAANSSFERVFESIEPENPELVRKMWDAEKYIDEDVLTPDRLPIDRDYALSMIDAFMFGYVMELAVEADSQAEDLN